MDTEEMDYQIRETEKQEQERKKKGGGKKKKKNSERCIPWHFWLKAFFVSQHSVKLPTSAQPS